MKLGPAEYAIWAFGGGSALAREIGYTRQAVSAWRWSIPTSIQASVLEAAKRLKLDVSAEDLISGRDVPDDEYYDEE